MSNDIMKLMASLGINPLDYEDIFQLVDQHYDELVEIMKQSEQWVPRADGIPALLILDDFTNSGAATAIPPAGEYVSGSEYAQMALALAILYQKEKPDDIYPSICPAMSAVLQWKFTQSSYNTCLKYMNPSSSESEG